MRASSRSSREVGGGTPMAFFFVFVGRVESERELRGVISSSVVLRDMALRAHRCVALRRTPARSRRGVVVDGRDAGAL
jgi:hypothetical protein